jgi:hypothetical protein
VLFRSSLLARPRGRIAAQRLSNPGFDDRGSSDNCGNDCSDRKKNANGNPAPKIQGSNRANGNAEPGLYVLDRCASGRLFGESSSSMMRSSRVRC